MTMFDRAFVKAYQQRQKTAGAASVDAAPVVLPPVDKTPVVQTPASPGELDAGIPPLAAAEAVMDAFSHGPALTGKSQILQPAARRVAYRDLDASRTVSLGGVALRVRVDRAEIPAAPSLAQLGDPDMEPALHAAPLPPPEEIAPKPHDVAPTVETPSAASVEAPPVADVETPPVADVEAPSAAEVEALWNAVQAMVDPAFVPGYQVDYLVWPPVCLQMGQKAAQQLDQLADALVGHDRRRHRLLGISSAGAGAGATTVAQCLAGRLAQAGLKVVVADASCRAPRLAERFGLVPELGWEQTAGPLRPVADLLVESMQDQLAVLPRCDGSPTSTLNDGHLEHLAQLRAHYDVAILDLGLLDEVDFASPDMAALAGCLDSLVIVHDVRGGEDDLARQVQRLRQAGVRELGVVENFAPL